MFKIILLTLLIVAVNSINLRNIGYKTTNFQPHDGELVHYDPMGNTHLLSQNVNCTNSGQYSAYCDYNGVCLSNGSCKCDDGYTTYPSDHNPGCNYKQKSMLIAFLLEFFIGYMTGAGRWYLGNTAYALAEVLVFWLGLIGACCCGCVIGATSGDEKSAGGCTYFVTLLASLTVFGLWLASWIMILTGQVHDSNGAPLQGF